MPRRQNRKCASNTNIFPLSFRLVHFANPLTNNSYVGFYVTHPPVKSLYVTHYTTPAYDDYSTAQKQQHSHHTTTFPLAVNPNSQKHF